MSAFEMVAGIETHVQLRTETKLFCGCAVRFGSPPNSLTCPVCLGHPGVLPVLNRKAFELAIRAALALNCTLAERTKFDRKHYFYPDLPKNYQISQYDLPLARNGHVELDDGRLIRIHRLHVEEDAGKLIHEEKGTRSLVDLNRAGVPLVEIVTEPELRSPEEVDEYLSFLKQTLQQNDISNCDMEKGELRCDLNVSVRPTGSKDLGVKSEVKNLNSFRFAKEAIRHEFDRQTKVLEAGGRIVQETRLYDPERGVTEVMRSKEEAHDYRYFPEPDLPPVHITALWIDKIKQDPIVNPRTIRKMVMNTYNLSKYDATVLTSSSPLFRYFESCVKLLNDPKKVTNWIANELLKVMNEARLEFPLKMTPEHFVGLIRMAESGEISAGTAKDLLHELAKSGRNPKDLVAEKGLTQVADAGALETVAKQVIAENAKIVADFQGGKVSALQALLGRMMKASQGRANPKAAEETLRRLLAP